MTTQEYNDIMAGDDITDIPKYLRWEEEMIHLVINNNRNMYKKHLCAIAEECAELQQELSKFYRGKGILWHMEEELTDVLLSFISTDAVCGIYTKSQTLRMASQYPDMENEELYIIRNLNALQKTIMDAACETNGPSRSYNEQIIKHAEPVLRDITLIMEHYSIPYENILKIRKYKTERFLKRNGFDERYNYTET